MATGDLQGNLERLRTELKNIKYTGDFDVAGIRLGDPVAFLPLLNYVLVKFSKHIAHLIAENGYELHGKTDARFVESAFKIMRELFNQKLVLTPAQFLEQGFAERKVLLLSKLTQCCKTQHNAAVRKQRLAAAVPPKLVSPQPVKKDTLPLNSRRLKPNKLNFAAHIQAQHADMGAPLVTRHTQQQHGSQRSSPWKVPQVASPAAARHAVRLAQQSTATSSAAPSHAAHADSHDHVSNRGQQDQHCSAASSLRASRKTWAESARQSCDFGVPEPAALAEQAFQPSKAWFLNPAFNGQSPGRPPASAGSDLPPEPHAGAYPAPLPQRPPSQQAEHSRAVAVQIPSSQQSSLRESYAIASPPGMGWQGAPAVGTSQWQPITRASVSGDAVQHTESVPASANQPSATMSQQSGHSSPMLQHRFSLNDEQPVEAGVFQNAASAAPATWPALTSGHADNEGPERLSASTAGQLAPDGIAVSPASSQLPHGQDQAPEHMCGAAASRQEEETWRVWHTELADEVARLRELLASVEAAAESSRHAADSAQQTLQARITVLEGRVRFLEGSLEALVPQTDPASRGATPPHLQQFAPAAQPLGSQAGQLGDPSAPDTPKDASMDKSAPGSATFAGRERGSVLQAQPRGGQLAGSPATSTAATGRTAHHVRAAPSNLTLPGGVPWRADAALAMRARAAPASPVQSMKTSQVSYRSTYDLINSIESRHRQAEAFLQSYGR